MCFRISNILSVYVFRRIAVGISKGFAVGNFLIKQIVLVHPTIQPDGLGSRSIGRYIVLVGTDVVPDPHCT